MTTASRMRCKLRRLCDVARVGIAVAVHGRRAMAHRHRRLDGTGLCAGGQGRDASAIVSAAAICGWMAIAGALLMLVVAINNA